MYLQIVVPTDGSGDSLRAFGPAKLLASACDAPVVVITVIGTDENVAHIEAELLPRLAGFDASTDRLMIVKGAEPAAVVLAELERVPGSLLCMRSSGHTHTEPILGLVTEAVLRGTTGPALLIGPQVDTDAWTLHSPMVVCADGSATAQTIVPLAAQWGITMGVDLTVCVVTNPDVTPDADTSESALPAHVARELQRAIGRPVDYDSLHGHDVPSAIIAFAAERNAGLIAAATHGRTGLKRIAMGSTTMALVHRAPMPVLTQRPPAFVQEP